MTKRILHLTLKAQWFEEIAAGTKKVEYREIKPYWTTRLKGQTFDEVHFRNGYAADAPFMRVQWKGMRQSRRNYEIMLGRVLECRRSH